MEVGREDFDDPLFSGEAATRMHAWCEIHALADDNGVVNLSVRRLAGRWRWSIGKVSTFVGELIAAQRLAVVRRSNDGSVYRILGVQSEHEIPAKVEHLKPRKVEHHAEPSRTTEIGAFTQPDLNTSAGENLNVFNDAHQNGTNGKPNKNKLKDPDKPETYSSDVHHLTDLVWKLGLYSMDGFSGRTYARQANKIKTMIEAHGAPVVEAAIRGARFVYPFDRDDRSGAKPPFDAFAVARRLVEAAAAWGAKSREREQAGARRAEGASSDQQRKGREAEHRQRHEEWEARIREKMRTLTEAELQAICKEAEKQVDGLPGASTRSEQQKKDYTRMFAMSVYGSKIGDLPPRL